ncbi:helix-turn-helix domain-containing protein [Paenibacillus sp. FSL R7-269]|nr:helix-turn-helix domain-containing protein [Paenibacillus sp. FSL R7-269]
MYQHIRDLREDKDLTQTQMAEFLQCSQRIIVIMNAVMSIFPQRF